MLVGGGDGPEAAELVPDDHGAAQPQLGDDGEDVVADLGRAVGDLRRALPVTAQVEG